MKKLRIIFILFLFTSCSVIPFIHKSKIENEILLEIVDDTQARQLYINGFEKLSTREKTFAYYMVQAGIAGRDIYYDQNNRRALEIRDLCEEVLLHARGLDDDTYENIRAYTYKFWMNCCQYVHSSKKKFIPGFTFQELLNASQAAVKNGADFMYSNEQKIGSYLDLLKPAIFDTSYQAMITAKNPPAGEDIITASANNFYENVTLAEINDWEQQGQENYPSNSKLAKKNGEILEQVYRVGLPDSGITAGMYATQLSEVIKYLELAMPYADSLQAMYLENMIMYYKTGHNKYASRAIIHWLHDNSRVDFLQGFLEVYTDPRGRKGAFQNVVYFVDEKRTEMMEQLVKLASYFEEKAPYQEKYKRKEFKQQPGVVAALVISGSGDGGPITPAGVNLPNDQQFRETYGSKNLIFTNVLGIGGGNSYPHKVEFVRKYVYEFYHPRDIEEIKKVDEDANFAMVCLHELIGHGSGKVSADLTGDPSEYLQEYYSTIEEARAELMALWNIHDERLERIGLVPNRYAADEVYRFWARYNLTHLADMENRTTFEQDHERARHLIVSYIREQGAINMVKIKGKLYTRVNSIEKFRQAVGTLLAEIMRIKAEGDYDAAKNLVQKYGIYINPAWRDEMVRRYKEIHTHKPIIKHTGFSFPILIPVKNKKGEIVDVRVKYLKDFEKEQLYYSGKVKVR